MENFLSWTIENTRIPLDALHNLYYLLYIACMYFCI
jgi:hypothetical protein